MCRFLLVQTKKPVKPQSYLVKFSEMARVSRALDGDWQGDGWGLAWIDNSGNWQVTKSLMPIWEEKKTFDSFCETTLFLVHARSATFPRHKNILEFNQPYITQDYAFVFNGHLIGVTLQNIPGNIGAEKIWYLLQKELQKMGPQEALEKIKEMLIQNSKQIVALNIGLATKTRIYSVSYFTKHPEYYTLYTYTSPAQNVICSEDIALGEQMR